MANANAEGRIDYGVNAILEAKAYDNLRPGRLVPNGPFFDDPDLRGGGAKITLDIFTTDGFTARTPFIPGNRTFPTRIPPPVFNSNWNISQLRGFVGDALVDTIQALKALYAEQVFGKDIISADEEFGVRGLLDAGIVVSLSTSEQRGAKHNSIADRMRPIVRAFNRGSAKTAFEEIDQARADSDYWNRVHGVVSAVSQLPSTILEGGAKGVFLVLKQFAVSNPVVFIGAVGLVGLLIAPNLLAAAKLIRNRGGS